MPLAIIEQPTAESLHAAYRPIVFKVEATYTTPPPVLYCDIYFGGTYYRTAAKTIYQSASAGKTVWQFDIQDPCQEILKKFIGTNGGSSILSTQLPFSLVYCKFRSSSKNADGFIEQEGAIPVQGTANVAPVAGGGLQSNSFYVVNAVLQHESNQNLQTHLNAFKRGTWNVKAFPLTHRPLEAYKICLNQNDYFPFIYLGDTAISGIRFKYREKGSTEYTDGNGGGSGPLCVSVSATYDFPAGQEGVAYSYSFTLNGTQPFSISNIDKPAWMNITLSGSTISVSGIPTGPADPAHVSFTIRNCDDSATLNVVDSFTVSPIPSCQAVALEEVLLLDAVADEAYDLSLMLSGDAPFSLINVVKPGWMNIAIVENSGSYRVQISGTPANSDEGTDIEVSFQITNCSGVGGASYLDYMDVTSTVTVGSVYFGDTIFESGDADHAYESARIVGDPGANVVVELTQYANNNPGGTLRVFGTPVTGIGQTFPLTIDSVSGEVLLPVQIEGTVDPGTVIMGRFEIVSTSLGTIGTPNTYQISKVF